MTEIALMNPSKETENKLRWETNVGAVEFKLYIPKRRVPRPWPVRIIVSIRNAHTGKGPTPGLRSLGPEGDASEQPIVAILDRRKEHTHTVRFTPRGDQQEWEIGEPYIPHSLLPDPSANTVQIEVRWDRSAGTWSDD